MAMQTSRIRLGTQVTPLVRRRPWKVAREAITLDYLSNGRIILGVGLGDDVSADVSFSSFGEIMDIKKRAQMLDEALKVLVGLWSGETFDFHGQYYQVNALKFLPPPIQRPRIPIWVGGAYPNLGPIKRAARWDGACLFKKDTHFMMPEDILAMKTFIIEQRGGLTNYDICVGGSPRREDCNEERSYIRSLAEAGITWWVEYVPPDQIEVMRMAIEKGPLRID
jgi:hypothetical protein